MRKFILSAFAVLSGMLGASAAVTTTDLTLVEHANTLVDGDVIALQCRDNNGGPLWWFNGGDQLKTEAFNEATALYRLAGNQTDGFTMQRVGDEKFVGRNGDNIPMVEEANAVKFTVASYGDTPFSVGTFSTSVSGSNTGEADFDKYVRFTVVGANTFLNTQGQAGNPLYKSGNGGYSAWFVYKAPAESVATYVTVTVNHVLNGKTFATTTASVESGTAYTPTATTDILGLELQGTVETITPTEDTPVTLNYAYTGNGIPFEVTTDENAPKLYSLKIRGTKTLTYRPSDGHIQNIANYSEALTDYNYFYFTGDNVNGIKFHVTGAPGKVLGMNEAVSNNAKYYMTDAANGNGFRFSINNGVNAFRELTHNAGHINDVNGEIGFWEAAASATDAGSNFTFEAVADSDIFAATINFTDVDNNNAVVGSQNVIAVAGHANHYTVPEGYSLTADAPATVMAVAGTTTYNVPVSGQFQITVNYVDGEGAPVVTKTLSVAPGQTVNFAENIGDFFTVNPASATASKETPTHTVTITGTVPFAWTPTTENVKWQAIAQHGGYISSNMIWTYENDSQYMKAYGHNGTASYTDAQLFAIVGNPVEGFTIYNRAAGMDKCLVKEGSNAYIKAAGSADTKWIPFKNTSGSNEPATYACFKQAGSTYINLQGVNTNTAVHSGNLNYWSATDNGSSCWFHAAGEPDLAKAASATTAAAPEEAYGYQAPKTVDEAAVAAVTADPYDMEAIATLRTALANLGSFEPVAFTPAGLYRLQNANYGNYLVIGDGDLASAQLWGGETAHMTNHNSIVSFVSTGTDGQYYLQSQGLYVGPVQKSQATRLKETTDDAGVFTVVPSTNKVAQYAVACQNPVSGTEADHAMLHQAGGNAIVGWNTNAAATYWYLMAAETVEVSLTAGYGVAYFPFPVKVGADSDAQLLYIYEGANTETGEPVVSYTAANVVPANTAVIVKGEGSSVILDIALNDEVDTDINNILDGSCRATTIGENDYAFGMQNGVVGFYKVSPIATQADEGETIAISSSVARNGIYLPETNVNAKPENGFVLSEPAVTGIRDINVSEGAANVIYDLQGRRVSRAAHGLYIINGQKTLVR